MIKIYGSPKSSAGRCYWTLEEIGLTYERVPLNMSAKEHKSPAFLKINPNGKVPCLVDGDFVLWESLAINSYLSERYRPELFGDDAETKAHGWQWSIWATGELQRPLVEMFIQAVFVPEERRDPQVVSRATEQAKPLYEILERHLEGRTYIVGPRFTLADINVGSVVALTQAIGRDLSAYPATDRWLKNLNERPARQRMLALP